MQIIKYRSSLCHYPSARLSSPTIQRITHSSSLPSSHKMPCKLRTGIRYTTAEYGRQWTKPKSNINTPTFSSRRATIFHKLWHKNVYSVTALRIIFNYDATCLLQNAISQSRWTLVIPLTRHPLGPWLIRTGRPNSVWHTMTPTEKWTFNLLIHWRVKVTHSDYYYLTFFNLPRPATAATATA